MNSEQLAHIVELIVARLQARQGNTITLSQEELRHASAMKCFLNHDALCLQQTDMCFLRALADGDQDNTAVAHLFEALALGMSVSITLNSRLLPCLPLKTLAKLPVTFMDEQGSSVVIHQANVLSYRDVVGLNACWLAISRKTVITALARDAVISQHIRLVKQE
ncbi:TPA: microcompartment protein PduM [Kluyvera intermedia]|nr:microcompartment protein PduM [Kluyvera intermedia]